MNGYAMNYIYTKIPEPRLNRPVCETKIRFFRAIPNLGFRFLFPQFPRTATEDTKKWHTKKPLCMPFFIRQLYPSRNSSLLFFRFFQIVLQIHAIQDRRQILSCRSSQIDSSQIHTFFQVDFSTFRNLYQVVCIGRLIHLVLMNLLHGTHLLLGTVHNLAYFLISQCHNLRTGFQVLAIRECQQRIFGKRSTGSNGHQ